MKLADIKIGMKLKAVGNYADCIKKSDEFTVFDHEGVPHIKCRKAIHALDKVMVHKDGNIPELEPADV